MITQYQVNPLQNNKHYNLIPGITRYITIIGTFEIYSEPKTSHIRQK